MVGVFLWRRSSESEKVHVPVELLSAQIRADNNGDTCVAVTTSTDLLVTPAQSPGQLLSAHNKVISVWVLQIKYYICKVINK